MWTFETHIRIAAPPERIWSLFADVAGWPAWNDGIESIEMQGPFANGSRFIMTPPGMEPFVSTLTDVRPLEGFTDVTEVGSSTVRVSHTLSPPTHGHTTVTYRAEVEGPEAASLGPLVTEDFDDVLAGLKRVAETA